MNTSEPVIEFEFGEAEIDAWYRHFLDTSPYVTRTIRIWQAIGSTIGLLLVALGVTLVAIADETWALVSGIFAAGYGAGLLFDLFWTFPKRYRKKWMNRIKKIGSYHSMSARFGRNKLWITGDTLEGETPIGFSRFPLAKLEKYVVTEAHALLYVDGQSAIVIPRHGIIEGDVDGFLVRVQEGMHKPQTPGEVKS